MQNLFEIIHEDDDLLVINKPAGLVCHPTKTDERSSLIGRIRLYLGKPAHLVNRLDRETSGVTIVAKNSPVAGELGKLWEGRQVEKAYLAIVHGRPSAESGIIDAPLGKDEQSKVAVKDCVRSDGAVAQTEYEVLRSWRREMRGAAQLFSLIRLRPLTGRKHQLRIHLAHIGCPIVGDKLYGATEDDYMALVENRLTPTDWERLLLPHQALHASEVGFRWRDRDARFSAEPEPWFKEFIGAASC